MNFLQRVCREAGELESVAHGGHPDLPGATVAVLLRFRTAAWFLENQQDHTDGIQSSFTLGEGAEWRVQLVAAESRWQFSGWRTP